MLSMTAQDWLTTKRDDSPHIEAAVREWNLNQPAWQPFRKFADLPPTEQSRVAMRAAQMSKGVTQ